MADFVIDLPYPPTANTLYATVKGRRVLSKKGHLYHANVWTMLLAKHFGRTFTGRLSVTLNVTCPDKRKRDLDNVLKAVLDALGKAGVYADDSQIDILHVYRVPEPKKPGAVDVAITRLRKKWWLFGPLIPRLEQ